MRKVGLNERRLLYTINGKNIQDRKQKEKKIQRTLESNQDKQQGLIRLAVERATTQIHSSKQTTVETVVALRIPRATEAMKRA